MSKNSPSCIVVEPTGKSFIWISTPDSAVAETARLVIPRILNAPPPESFPWKFKLGVISCKSDPD